MRAAAISVLLAAVASAQQAADRPSVILFLADDMGMGDVRAYDESSSIPTPSMDRLAAEGCLFRDAHSPSAVCTPTRYSVLSGEYAFRSELDDFVLRSAYDAPLLDPQRESLAALLRRAGYATAAFGKWHLGMRWTNRAGDGAARPGVGASRFTTTDVDFAKPILEGPLDLGFDRFFGLASSIHHGPYTFVDDRRVAEVPTELRERVLTRDGAFREGWVAPGWRDDGQGEAISTRALEWLREHLQDSPEQPFFLYYAAVANHSPHVPPKELHGHPIRGAGGQDDGLASRNDMIVQNDVILGQLLELLAGFDGAAENTLVILTSDNGADGGRYTPMRGGKGSIYEGGHRVPFVARWPRRLPAGSVSDALLGLNDLYRSLAALAGAEPAEGAARDSEDLSALLSGADLSAGRGRALIVQDNGTARRLAAIDGRWKLVVRDGEAVALDDRLEDPRETRNRLGKIPDKAAELLAFLEAERSD